MPLNAGLNENKVPKIKVSPSGGRVAWEIGVNACVRVRCGTIDRMENEQKKNNRTQTNRANILVSHTHGAHLPFALAQNSMPSNWLLTK